MDTTRDKETGAVPELETAFEEVRTLFGQPNRTGVPVELEVVFHNIRELFGQPNRTNQPKVAGQPSRTA